MSTTIPAMKAALVSVLAAALPDVQVIYGAPGGEVTLGPSVLAVGETVTGAAALDSLTRDTAQERYRVSARLSCTVEQPGDDGAQAAATLAWAYFATAEQAVRERQPEDWGVAWLLGVNSTGEFTGTDVAMAAGRNTTIEFGFDVIAQRT
jgi:hypothetical protein